MKVGDVDTEMTADSNPKKFYFVTATRRLVNRGRGTIGLVEVKRLNGLNQLIESEVGKEKA